MLSPLTREQDDMTTTHVIDDELLQKLDDELRPRKRDLQPLAYSILEAVEVSKCCHGTLYQEMKAGRLRFLKRGSRTLILREDLLDWLKSHRAEKLGGAFGHAKKAAA
jgi:excisionase family DNA binding protein